MIDKIQQIADYYGYEAQSRQLIEKMAELAKAINKLWRCENGLIDQQVYMLPEVRRSIHLDSAIEEIADVEICLEYVKYLLDIAPEDVDKVKKTKIERELNRIAERELDKRNFEEAERRQASGGRQ